MRPAKNLVFYQTLAPAARNCGGRGFSRTDLIETRGLRVAAGSRNCAEARVRAINCGTRGFAQLRAIAGFAAFFFLSRLSFQRFLPRPIRNRASREHFSQLKGSPPRAIARKARPGGGAVCAIARTKDERPRCLGLQLFLSSTAMKPARFASWVRAENRGAFKR